MATRRQRGVATRDELIDVARRFFSEYGYHGTGLADIQAATGLTKGAFYHHFATKEELALAVLESARADYANRLIEPAMLAPTPGARIAALLEGAVRLNAQPDWCNCQMMMTLCTELTAADDRLRNVVMAMQSSMYELWERLLTEAHASGEANPAIAPALGAQLLVNTILGFIATKKLGGARVPPEAPIELVKRLLLTESTINPDRAAAGETSTD